MQGKKTRGLPKYRVFRGKRYTFVEGVSTKSEAKRSAEQMRKAGNSVHIVPTPKGYALYARWK